MYKLIKHRGFHNDAILENTYDAILKAFQMDKYMGVEFDVRETKDHEFIIYHDATYNYKLISEYLYIELPKFIPKLNDILKIKTSKMFLIELKSISSFAKFIKLLNKYSNKNIYVMSFSNSLISKVNVINKTYKVGILNYVLNTNNSYQELDFVAILNSLLDQKIMNILHDKEIFSYGLFEKLKYENVYYIVDK